MIQDKAQSAGNGESFSRTATPYWIIRVAPFGRAVKRSSAAMRIYKMGSTNRSTWSGCFRLVYNPIDDRRQLIESLSACAA